MEFALVIPIVLFLLFGVFEFGRYYYTRISMQHAVSEAARFAVTGAQLVVGEDTLPRAGSITEMIVHNASTLSIDVDDISIDPPDGGRPGEVVTVDAGFSFQFVAPGYSHLFPGGVLDFRVSTAMRNEMFLSGTYITSGEE